jgi:hypothetical protein
MSKVYVGICPECRLWAEFYQHSESKDWFSECCHSAKDRDYLEEIIMDDDESSYKTLSLWSQ